MSKTKECRGCFNPIDARASICIHCGLLQSGLKALSIYVAGVAGLFTLIASLSTYLYGEYIEASNNRDPIQILSYIHKSGGVFLNKSNNPVYIRSILLLGNNRHNLYSEEIQTIVEGKGFLKYNNPKELFVLSPRLENRQKHWDEAWKNKSVCFDILLLFEKAYLDKELTESIGGILSYINSNDGRMKEKNFSMKAALLLKDKPECGSFGHPDTIFK